MAISVDESAHLALSLCDIDGLCPVAKALASPVRARMLALLSIRSMNVNELAEALSLPVSTAALNVRQLEEARLITCSIQPGIRGAMKLCSRRVDSIHFSLAPHDGNGERMLTVSMPLGSYFAADRIAPGSGLASEYAILGEGSTPRSFYHPDRVKAQMIWLSGGELEYRFSPSGVDPAQVEWLEFSFECSASTRSGIESPSSELVLSVNDRRVSTLLCESGYAPRRGKLNPGWWNDASSQFGLLRTWRVDGSGSTIDGEPLSAVTIRDLELWRRDYIALRIGLGQSVPQTSGITLFGEKFGDHPQGIVMRAGYGVKPKES